MEKSKRKRIVAIALIGAALASFAIAGFSLAASSRGAAKSAVFAKVYGLGDNIYLDVVGEWHTLLSIQLPYIRQSLYYHVVCDGWCNTFDGQLKIAIGVDSATEDISTRRYYTSEAPNYMGIHTERVYYLKPGSHTFYFLGTKYMGGAGENPMINYHTITVTVFTEGSLTELTGTAQGDVAPDGTPR